MTKIASHHAAGKDMGAECDSCATRSFHRSRLQGKDFWTLLLLHYPVRCAACSLRQSVPLTVAMRASSTRIKQPRSSSHASSREQPSMTQQSSSHQSSSDHLAPAIEPQPAPTRKLMAMPDLRGVLLDHHSPLPLNNERPSGPR
jgi:hypothetical protein